MPKTKEQCEKIKTDRKNEILISALHLFSLRGYDVVTVDDITDASSCSHGLFYHYFNSKEDVFKELLEYARKKFLDQKIKNEEIDKPAIFILREITKENLNIIDSKSDLPYIFHMFINFHLQKTLPPCPNGKLPPSAQKDGSGPFVRLSGLIERGQREGDIRPGNPLAYATIYMSILKGLSYTRINQMDKTPIKIDVDIIMNLFSKGETNA